MHAHATSLIALEIEISSYLRRIILHHVPKLTEQAGFRRAVDKKDQQSVECENHRKVDELDGLDHVEKKLPSVVLQEQQDRRQADKENRQANPIANLIVESCPRVIGKDRRLAELHEALSCHEISILLNEGVEQVVGSFQHDGEAELAPVLESNNNQATVGGDRDTLHLTDIELIDFTRDLHFDAPAIDVHGLDAIVMKMSDEKVNPGEQKKSDADRDTAADTVTRREHLAANDEHGQATENPDRESATHGVPSLQSICQLALEVTTGRERRGRDRSIGRFIVGSKVWVQLFLRHRSFALFQEVVCDGEWVATEAEDFSLPENTTTRHDWDPCSGYKLMPHESLKSHEGGCWSSHALRT